MPRRWVLNVMVAARLVRARVAYYEMGGNLSIHASDRV